MFRSWLLMVACGCLVGCLGGTGGVFAPVEFDLYEAVLRQLASGPATNPDGKRVVFYVSLENEDLPDAILSRFRGQTSVIEPASHYRADDRAIAAHVVRIQSEVQWLDADHPRVFVLDHPVNQTPDCGTPYPIPLRRQAGKWVIVNP